MEIFKFKFYILKIKEFYLNISQKYQELFNIILLINYKCILFTNLNFETWTLKYLIFEIGKVCKREI